MPEYDFGKQEGDSEARGLLLEASVGDSAEEIASRLLSREAAKSFIALLLHVAWGHVDPALGWLDEFSKAWGSLAHSAKRPWGRLTSLPMIIVDTDKLDAKDRNKFASWGVSSFTNGRAAEVVVGELEASLNEAFRFGAFEKPSEVETKPISIESDEQNADPAMYAEALRALKALGDGYERED